MVIKMKILIIKKKRTWSSRQELMVKKKIWINQIFAGKTGKMRNNKLGSCVEKAPI